MGETERSLFREAVTSFLACERKNRLTFSKVDIVCLKQKPRPGVMHLADVYVEARRQHTCRSVSFPWRTTDHPCSPQTPFESFHLSLDSFIIRKILKDPPWDFQNKST